MTGAKFLNKKMLEDAAAIKRAIQETASDGRRQTSLEGKKYHVNNRRNGLDHEYKDRVPSQE